MQTSIKQITPVEYELSIDATAQDLAPQIESRLRDQRAGISLKGFRKGKVPMGLLKKMFGESLVIDVVEKSVLNAFQEEVVEPGEYEVLGMPSISEFDYKLDGDLHAVMKFGVRPTIELADLSGEKVLKLVHETTEEEIDKAIEQILKERAEMRTREDGGIEGTDYVTVDMQRLDPGTMTPIVGEKEEDVAFYLDDEQLKEQLRDALMGKQADDTFQVHLPETETGENPAEEPSSELLVVPGQESKGASETSPYQVYVKEVKQVDLPELDEEFIKGVTREEAEDEEGLRTFVRKSIESTWEKESRDLLESELMRTMLETHDFPVPDSAVEVFLNSFLEDVRRRYGKELPEDFNVEAFKNANRGDAVKQAKWQLLREVIIETEELEVTDEDRSAFFLDMSGGKEEEAASMQGYYQAISGLMEQLDQRLLTKKIFDALADRMTIESKSRDEYVEALKERNAQQEALKI